MAVVNYRAHYRTPEWRQLREMVFARQDGFCACCKRQGKVGPAQELDHIVPMAKLPADADFYAEANLQGLCRECHMRKTAEENAERSGYVPSVAGLISEDAKEALSKAIVLEPEAEDYAEPTHTAEATPLPESMPLSLYEGEAKTETETETTETETNVRGIAESTIRWMEQNLTLDDGRPYVPLEYQAKFLGDLLETDAESGLRKATSGALIVPRKNGKSTFIAAMMVASLCGPLKKLYSNGGQIVVVPNSPKQGDMLMRIALGFLQRNSQVLGNARPRKDRHKDGGGGIIYSNDMRDKSIECLDDGMLVRLYPKDEEALQGLNVAFGIIDEYSEFENSEALDSLEQGASAQVSPTIVVISTLSPNVGTPLDDLLARLDEDSTGWIKHVYCAPKEIVNDEEKVLALETAEKCNPALGSFLSYELLKQQIGKAKHSPLELRRYMARRLNLKVPSESCLVDAIAFGACVSEGVETPAKGARCLVGIDLSEKHDFSALSMYFPDSGIVLSHSWACRAGRVFRSHSMKELLTNAEAKGYLTVHDTQAVDYDRLVREMSARFSHYDYTIYTDRKYYGFFTTAAERAGIELQEPVYVAQTPENFNIAFEAIRQKLYKKELSVEQNPILRFAVESCVQKAGKDTTEVRPAKLNENAKIDALMALAFALWGDYQEEMEGRQGDVGAVLDALNAAGF